MIIIIIKKIFFTYHLRNYYKLALLQVKKFIDYSKKIGQDFMLCQGPGGNTSFKIDNIIYIKKSGLHLSKATNDTFQKIEYLKF